MKKLGKIRSTKLEILNNIKFSKCKCPKQRARDLVSMIAIGDFGLGNLYIRIWLRSLTVFGLFVLFVAGCATSLEKGHMQFKAGDHIKARKYYMGALDREKERCSTPEWAGSEYVYRLNAPDAADAIMGIANTYRAEKKRDSALYYYFYYVQFCLRHGLECYNEIENIRSYILEDKKGDEHARFEKLIGKE